MRNLRKNELSFVKEEHLTPLHEQWPSLRFLGLGAWWAWIWLSYNSIEIMRLFPSDLQAPYVMQMYLFSTIGIGASMFGSAITWKGATALIDKHWFVMALGTLAGIFTVLLGFSGLLGEEPIFALAALLTGIGTTALCLKTGRIYGSIPLGDSLTAGAISLLLAAFLYFVGIGIPEEIRLIYIGAMPIVSAALLCMGEHDPFPSARLDSGESHSKNTPERRRYHKLVVASALVAFTAGVGKGLASQLGDAASFARTGSITVFCVGIIAVVIIALVNRRNAVKGARQVYSGLIVIGVAMMLATCFGFDIAYLSIGKESLWMVFSCFMAYMAFRYDFSAIRVFGIGQGAYFLASTAGWAIGGFVLAPYYGDTIVRVGVGVALAFLVVLVFVYVFSETDLKRIVAWSIDTENDNRSQMSKCISATQGADVSPSDAEAGADFAGVAAGADVGVGAAAAAAGAGASAASAVTSAAASTAELKTEMPEEPKGSQTFAITFGSQYGLSARELEVLELFAQGRSANWIAESLFISKNTVRSHLRAIYTKLDVHTRQELLNLLDSPNMS